MVIQKFKGKLPVGAAGDAVGAAAGDGIEQDVARAAPAKRVDRAFVHDGDRHRIIVEIPNAGI